MSYHNFNFDSHLFRDSQRLQHRLSLAQVADQLSDWRRQKFKQHGRQHHVFVQGSLSLVKDVQTRSRAAPPSTRGRELEIGDRLQGMRTVPDDIEPKLEIRKIAHLVSTPRSTLSRLCSWFRSSTRFSPRRVSANFSVRFTSNWRFTTWSRASSSASSVSKMACLCFAIA